ncbi:MAG: AhpC/TSA family protein [Bacteroidetes bacterium]|nr:AhpC/TSA family protein [Bacteroidota bacterium]
MKKITLLALASIALYSCGPSNSGNTSGFELKGTLSNSKGESIYLEKLAQSGVTAVDSAVINEKGEFLINHYSPSVGFYRLRISNSNFAMLVLDSAQKVTVTADARDLGNTFKAEGSPDTQLFLDYNKLAQGQKVRTDSLENIFRTAMVVMKLDSIRADSLSKELQKPYEVMIGQYSDIVAKKIKENSNSFASIMAIQQLRPENYLDVYKALDKGLSERYPDNKDIKSYHAMVQQAEMMVARTQAIKVGAEAPELILPMPNDKDLALSSLRGKVVLIDFWASWCAPCRKELPNVKHAYEKYKSKGFEILGVSLDKDRTAWLEAISKEGLTWPQVSDLKFWQSEACSIYAVQSIPYTVLIDKEGKIIATDLRGAELEKKLAEVLK